MKVDVCTAGHGGVDQAEAAHCSAALHKPGSQVAPRRARAAGTSETIINACSALRQRALKQRKILRVADGGCGVDRGVARARP